MATVLHRYRIRCETDGNVYEWAEVEPTTCPIVPAHTIGDISIEESRNAVRVTTDPVMEPVVPGASKVLANDRPAIEIMNGVTGFAAIQEVWPCEQLSDAVLRVAVKFILKTSGTGSDVRIAAKLKSHAIGEDSSAAWDDTGFVVAGINFTNVGDGFEGILDLDASSCKLGDAVALQVGRDGNNEMGAGDNDDVDVAVQILGLLAEAF